MPGRYDDFDEDMPRRKSGQKSVVKKKGAAGSSASSASRSRAQYASAPQKKKTGSVNKPRPKRPDGEDRPKKPVKQTEERRPESRKKPSERAKGERNTPEKIKKPIPERAKKQPSPERTKKQKPSVKSSKPRPQGPRPVKKSKAKSRAQSKLATTLTYAAIIAGFMALMTVLALTVFFKVDKITIDVSGTCVYTREEILAAGELSEGGSIFKGSIDDAKQLIEKRLPYIACCDVEKNMPNEVKLKVEAAVPGGVVTYTDGMRLIISDSGKVLEMLAPEGMLGEGDEYEPEDMSDSDMLSYSDIDEPDDLTQFLPDKLRPHSAFVNDTELTEIRGLAVSQTDVGDVLGTNDETAFVTLKTLTRMLEVYALKPDWIDLSSGNLYVHCEGRMIIKLGSGTQLEEKMKLAAEIIHKNLTEYDSGQIDVTNPSTIYFTPSYILEGRQ